MSITLLHDVRNYFLFMELIITTAEVLPRYEDKNQFVVK